MVTMRKHNTKLQASNNIKSADGTSTRIQHHDPSESTAFEDYRGPSLGHCCHGSEGVHRQMWGELETAKEILRTLGVGMGLGVSKSWL